MPPWLMLREQIAGVWQRSAAPVAAACGMRDAGQAKQGHGLDASLRALSGAIVGVQSRWL